MEYLENYHQEIRSCCYKRFSLSLGRQGPWWIRRNSNHRWNRWRLWDILRPNKNLEYHSRGPGARAGANRIGKESGFILKHQGKHWVLSRCCSNGRIINLKPNWRAEERRCQADLIQQGFKFEWTFSFRTAAVCRWAQQKRIIEVQAIIAWTESNGGANY